MPKIPKAQADVTTVGTPKNTIKETSSVDAIRKKTGLNVRGEYFDATDAQGIDVGNYSNPSVIIARAKMHPERGDITVSHSEVTGSKRGK